MLAHHCASSNSYKFNISVSVASPWDNNKYVSSIIHSHTFIAIHKATHTHTVTYTHTHTQAHTHKHTHTSTHTHTQNTHTSARAFVNLYRYTCIYGIHKQPSRQMQKIIIIKTTIDYTRWPCINLWPEYFVDPYIAV